MFPQHDAFCCFTEKKTQYKNSSGRKKKKKKFRGRLRRRNDSTEKQLVHDGNKTNFHAWQWLSGGSGGSTEKKMGTNPRPATQVAEVTRGSCTT